MAEHCEGCRCAEIETQKKSSLETQAVVEKLNTGAAFSDDELRYAAYDRCECGAGLAYPKHCPLNHYWDCSDILTHRAPLKDQPGARRHSGRFQFVFWEFKSEDQPSAKGATTRPRLEVVNG